MSARNETPHKIIQSLGKKKCNGSWEEVNRKPHDGSSKENR